MARKPHFAPRLCANEACTKGPGKTRRRFTPRTAHQQCCSPYCTYQRWASTNRPAKYRKEGAAQ